MTHQEARTWVRNLLTDVWERKNLIKFDEYYHKDVVGHYRGQLLDYSDVLNRIEYGKAHFADGSFAIDDLIVEGNKIFERFTYHATLMSSGESFQSSGIYVYHLRDGKISEFWHFSDTPFNYNEKP